MSEEPDQELFVCDDCNNVLRDPEAAPRSCMCGGKFWRYVRP